MRTTLTIDPDIALMLKHVQQNHNMRFREVVNEALRRGLHDMVVVKKTEPFRTRSVDLGELRISGIDNIAEVLAVAEGEGFR